MQHGYQRSLVPPFALFAYIFPKYNCMIKKRERKVDGKTAKANSREQDLSVTFSCCMSNTVATVEGLPTGTWKC